VKPVGPTEQPQAPQGRPDDTDGGTSSPLPDHGILFVIVLDGRSHQRQEWKARLHDACDADFSPSS
jgi:hypothetical protein